jgi:hypothetical protein
MLPGLAGILFRAPRLEQEDQQRVAVFLHRAADPLVEARRGGAMQSAAQGLVLEQVGVRLERVIPGGGELGVGCALAVERSLGVARSPWRRHSPRRRGTGARGISRLFHVCGLCHLPLRALFRCPSCVICHGGSHATCERSQPAAMLTIEALPAVPGGLGCRSHRGAAGQHLDEFRVFFRCPGLSGLPLGTLFPMPLQAGE